MFEFIKRLFKKEKGWAKIEDGYNALSTFTEYTDHDGMVYRMYDLRPDPGFKEAVVTCADNTI